MPVSLRSAAHLSCAALAVAALVVPAHAQVTTFTDRSAFNAATSNLTTIDFNDQVPAGQAFAFYPGATVTLQGVTFTGNGLLFAIDPILGYGLGDDTVLSFQQAPGPQVLTVNLPAGVTAFGLDFGGRDSGTFTFALSTGDSFTFTGSVTPTDTPTFAGFTSTSAITGFTITAPRDITPQIDRFSFGSARVTPQNPIPEPSEYAVGAMFAGTLLIGMVRGRRRKSISKAA